MNKTAYDETPYESYPYPECHPDRFSVMARLFGMEPPAKRNFRYLEIGCAGGGNIIPLALQYPESEFLGIDYAQVQVDFGKRIIHDLELKNVTIQQSDIMELEDSLGRFDYIVAHGIYSWVPDPVRERLMKVFKQLLKPEGIAYVSYNVYPGWKLREIIRDMMRFQSRSVSDIEDKSNKALSFVQATHEALKNDNSTYATVLKNECSTAVKALSGLVIHDYLAAVNQPVYFHDFVGHIEKEGLSYFADTDFYTIPSINKKPEAIDALVKRVDGMLELEQHTDYVKNRYFRRSLLVHDGRELGYHVKNEAFKEMHFTLVGHPKFSGNVNLKNGAKVEFTIAGDKKTVCQDPISKCVLMMLGEAWPKTLSYKDLSKSLKKKLKNLTTETEIEQGLCLVLRSMYAQNFISIFNEKLNVVNKLSNKPEADPYIRYEATFKKWVTNGRNEVRVIDEFAQNLLQFVDGKRDRKQLQEKMVEVVKQGVLPLYDGRGQLVTDDAVINRSVKQAIETSLNSFVTHAFLIS